MKKRWTAAIVCLSLSFSPAIVKPEPVSASTLSPVSYGQPISVKLIAGFPTTSDWSFVLSGTYITSGGKTLTSGTYKVGANNGEIRLMSGSTTVETSTELSISPVTYGQDNTFTYGGNAYLGKMTFEPVKVNDTKYRVSVTNTLEFEDYLKGVVPHEMMDGWGRQGGMEALKAQAITARTYVKKKGTMEIDNSTNNQVYKGYNPSHASSHQAVDQTKGLTLMHNDKYAETFYSSTNGGRMMSAYNSWGSSLTAFPYLTNASDPYSTKAGKYLNWNLKINEIQINPDALNLNDPDLWWNSINEKDAFITNTKNELKARLKTSPTDTTIRDVKILSIDQIKFQTTTNSADTPLKGSVRIQYYLKENNKIIMENDAIKKHSLIVSDFNDKLRRFFGTDVLRSPNISSVTRSNGVVTVKGNGFGHGIGMSQWGAFERSKDGQSVQSILSFYYPGTSLRQESPPTVTKASAKVDGKDVVLSFSTNQQATVRIMSKDTIVHEGVYESGNHTHRLDTTSFQDGKHSFRISIGSEGRTVSVEVKDPLKPILSNTSIKANKLSITTNYTIDRTSDIRILYYKGDTLVHEALSNNAGKGPRTHSFKATEGGAYSVTIEATHRSSGTKATSVQNITLASTPVSTDTIHVVKAGDTLWGISQTYKAAVSDIQKWNKLASPVIFNGQRLVVKKGNPAPVPTPSPVKPNPSPPSPATPPPTPATKTHTVKKGDTLYGISLQYKVSVANLQKWNNMKTTTISVGQSLKVSAGSTSTSSNPPSPQPTKTKSYTVKKGDTLWGISSSLKVSVSHLQKSNKLSSTVLKIGQKLTY